MTMPFHPRRPRSHRLGDRPASADDVAFSVRCPWSSELVRISVVIPALNEAASIGRVLDAIPRELVTERLVIDNGSTDDTARVAAEHGARVLAEPARGY